MRGVHSQYDNAGVLVTVISAFGRDAHVGQVTETDETTRGAPAWRLIRNPSIPCSPGRLRCHSTQRLCDPFTRLKIGQCSDKLRTRSWWRVFEMCSDISFITELSFAPETRLTLQLPLVFCTLSTRDHLFHAVSFTVMMQKGFLTWQHPAML